jgi:hypothetical protein
VLLWNYQEVGWGYWGNVSEGQAQVVLVENVCFELFTDDFAEDCCVRVWCILAAGVSLSFEGALQNTQVKQERLTNSGFVAIEARVAIICLAWKHERMVSARTDRSCAAMAGYVGRSIAGKSRS